MQLGKDMFQKAQDGFDAAGNGAPRGKYQVMVRFVVSKDGSTAMVRVFTNHFLVLPPVLFRGFTNQFILYNSGS